MTTPSPATFDLTISRGSGFLQDIQLRCDGGSTAVKLQGYRYLAQLWALDRSTHYLNLEVPVVNSGDGGLTLQLTSAVARGILTSDEPISGGDADETGDPPALSGGSAATVFATEPLSGGAAWIGLLPEVTRWDLLQINPSEKRMVLLRGTATLVQPEPDPLDYWSDWVAQNYGWESLIFIDWWGS
jgi:hypothetical protein